MKPSRKKFFAGFGVAFAALAVLGGGYYLLRYQVWAGYRTWSIGRMNSMARNFIQANDPRSAMLTVRKVLSSRPNDVEAWRLGVKAAEMNGTNEAVGFQYNLCRVQKNTENYVELMRLALKYEAYNYGVDAITEVAADARGLPEYHRMAAELYRQVHRELAAKYHLLSLLSLAPGDSDARMALAELEFEIAPDGVPADWTKRVGELAQKPDTELRASLLQLRAAVSHGAGKEAVALAEKLRRRPDLTLTQRLNVLEAALRYDPAAPDLVANLQQQVAAQPADVAQVMDFLSAQAKSEVVRTWYPDLPTAVREDERVKLATAESLEKLHDWAGLQSLLIGASWKTDEYLRRSLLARAYRETGHSLDFAESWKIAMISAGQDPRRITRLLRQVEVWRWDNERYDLLWRLFNLKPTNVPVQQFLVAREFHAGKTVNLNKIYARLVEADPDDENARNNFAYTSLLMDTNPGRAQAIARELFKLHPENVSFRTTYALALYKQGQSREALTLMEQLDPVTRLAPVPMVHEAAFAAASGQIERAETLLPELAGAQLLPEQRQLAAAASMEIARRQTAQGKLGELMAQVQPAPGAASGWLALLPEHARDASVDIKLSDSYLRSGNFTALRQLLHAARWKDNEYLRYALLTYVDRSEAREDGARDYWLQTFGAAGYDSKRLHDLEVLTKKWNWEAERIDVVGRIFERESSDRKRLAELLDYYRRNARTSDMARVLWRYVNQTNTAGTEAAWCVYYSLLCGMNVSPAQTLAARVYGQAPNDPRHRVAYAFALWRQRRSAEALTLIRETETPDMTGMQVALVEAGALLELGRKEEAGKILNRFTSVNAVPEEINLAATLFKQAGLPIAVNAFTLK